MRLSDWLSCEVLLLRAIFFVVGGGGLGLRVFEVFSVFLGSLGF